MTTTLRARKVTEQATMAADPASPSRTGRPVRMRTVAWSLVTCALTEYADGHNYSD